jgi:hypothetical protein
MTVKGASRPSVNVALPPRAPSTTCADVTRNPSGVMTTPDPLPSPRRRATERLATDGRRRSATRVTTVE